MIWKYAAVALAASILRPYEPVQVPPVKLENSQRLAQLVRAGAIYLTAQDAVALALENNIDIEIARYNPLIARWRIVRAEAGGALPGVPSAASQAGAVAAGQGVAGSQAAAGVRITGTGQNQGRAANVTITQIGPVTQTLDPTIQEATTFSHTSIPQPNIIQSITPVLISNTRAHNASLQQGFLTGGSVNLGFTNNYLNENSPTDVLNPSSAPNLAMSLQHNLLRGFGVAVNARTITVARMNAGMSELSFKAQVIDIATRVLNLYYSLAAAGEDVAAKRSAFEAARTFQGNVRKQVELGALPPIDMVSAEAQVASTSQALVDSEAGVRQQEILLKNLISRTGTADPLVASARIVCVDRIAIPDKDDLPPVEDLVKEALANRPDLAVERQNVAAAETSALGTRNGILPTLQVLAGASNAGLAGTPRVVSRGEFTQTADPYFVGGVGKGLGQVFRRNFPTERAGAFYTAPIHNGQAQADYAIDQLQLRQTQLTTQRDMNQVQVTVLNSVIALQQARARHDSAVQNRVLAGQLLTAEQKKYSLGASTPYNVIQAQRDLAAAQSAEVASLAAYSAARIALEQATGATLAAHHVELR